MSRYSKGRWSDKLAGQPLEPSSPAKAKGEQMRMGRENHDALERSVVDLAWRKFRVPLFKADATARRTKSGGYVCNVTPGLPDRIGALPPTGRFVGFEIKTGKSKCRNIQNFRGDQLQQAGAVVFVIRSLDDCDRVLTKLLSEERQKADHLRQP